MLLLSLSCFVFLFFLMCVRFWYLKTDTTLVMKHVIIQQLIVFRSNIFFSWKSLKTTIRASESVSKSSDWTWKTHLIHSLWSPGNPEPLCLHLLPHRKRRAVSPETVDPPGQSQLPECPIQPCINQWSEKCFIHDLHLLLRIMLVC